MGKGKAVSEEDAEAELLALQCHLKYRESDSEWIAACCLCPNWSKTGVSCLALVISVRRHFQKYHPGGTLFETTPGARNRSRSSSAHGSLPRSGAAAAAVADSSANTRSADRVPVRRGDSDAIAEPVLHSPPNVVSALQDELVSGLVGRREYWGGDGCGHDDQHGTQRIRIQQQDSDTAGAFPTLSSSQPFDRVLLSRPSIGCASEQPLGLESSSGASSSASASDSLDGQSSEDTSCSETSEGSHVQSSSSEDCSEPVELAASDEVLVKAGTAGWYKQHRLSPVCPGHTHSTLHFSFKIAEMRRSGCSAKSCNQAAKLLRDSLEGCPGARKDKVFLPPSLHNVRHVLGAVPAKEYLFFWCPGCGHRYSGADNSGKAPWIGGDMGCPECGHSSKQVGCTNKATALHR